MGIYIIIIVDQTLDDYKNSLERGCCT